MSNIGKPLRSDIVPDHISNQSGVNTLVICGKSYEFSDEMLKKYPMLLDPSARYTVSFDDILPLIYEYDPSVLPSDLFCDNSRKQMFLSNIEFFQIPVSDAMILHLSKSLREDIQECSDFVQREAGNKGRGKNAKVRFSNLKTVVEFCCEHDQKFLNADVKPLDIVKYLEIGTQKAIDTLVLHDWRSSNLVMPFVKSFLERFLSKSV